MRLVLFINREYRSIVPFDKDYYLCHDSEITTSDLCYRLLPWQYYTFLFQFTDFALHDKCDS